MTTQTSQPFRVLERTTAVYSAVIEDDSGNPIPAASLSALTLTLYDVASGSIINSRDDQPVLNANNVTVDGSGNLAWTLQPVDNVIVGADIRVGGHEYHVALFEGSYAGGDKSWKHEVNIRVKNLGKVP